MRQTNEMLKGKEEKKKEKTSHHRRERRNSGLGSRVPNDEKRKIERINEIYAVKYVCAMHVRRRYYSMDFIFHFVSLAPSVCIFVCCRFPFRYIPLYAVLWFAVGFIFCFFSFLFFFISSFLLIFH